MKSLKRQQAAKIIEEHFRAITRAKEDVLVSGREAGRRMVEIYRLLTGEMPQAPGIESEFRADELPALEWASPSERDPNEVFQVIASNGLEPDIIIPGDQNGSHEPTDKQIKQDRKTLLPPKGGGHSSSTS